MSKKDKQFWQSLEMNDYTFTQYYNTKIQIIKMLKRTNDI